MHRRWTDAVLRQGLGLRPGERVLVMADRPLRPAADALAEAARALGGAEVMQHVLPEPGPLQVVSRSLAAAAAAADAVVRPAGGAAARCGGAPVPRRPGRLPPGAPRPLGLAGPGG